MRAAAPPTSRNSSTWGSHSACQAPVARSCSWAIDPSTVATSPGTRRVAAVTSTAPIGLCLWGRVEDPPRPSPPSLTSPSSVWASKVTSRAILARTPAATPRAAASSATRTRLVCQARTGSASPSSSA